MGKPAAEVGGGVAVGKDFLQALDMFDDLEGDEAMSLMDLELRRQVTRRAIEAYRRDEISRGRLLGLGKPLGISGAKLVALAEAARAEPLQPVRTVPRVNLKRAVHLTN